MDVEKLRRSRRINLESQMKIKRLDTPGVPDLVVDITDVSKSGLGFICNQEIPKGAMYETYLTIWTKEVIHTMLEVVRVQKRETDYEYGVVFIGMTDIDSSRIAVYDMVDEEKRKMNG